MRTRSLQTPMRRIDPVQLHHLPRYKTLRRGVSERPPRSREICVRKKVFLPVITTTRPRARVACWNSSLSFVMVDISKRPDPQSRRWWDVGSQTKAGRWDSDVAVQGNDSCRISGQYSAVLDFPSVLGVSERGASLLPELRDWCVGSYQRAHRIRVRSHADI